jgi:exonuclease SbcC
MRLLHDEPARRQDMLISLLDLGVYDRMGQAARLRAAAAEQEATVASELLAKLASATPEARAAAAEHLGSLDTLRSEVTAARPQLEAQARAAAEARAEQTTAAGRVELLDAVVAPEGVDQRSTELAEARAAADQADAVEAAAQRDVDAAEAALDALGSRAELDATLSAHRDRTGLAEQLAHGEPVLADRRVAEAATVAAHQAAEAELAESSEALERVRWQHRAHDLARSLVAGEACPVCRQEVTALPPLTDVAAVDEAAAARDAAEAAVRRAAAARQKAERARVEAETNVASLTAALARLDDRLAGTPDPTALTAQLREAAAAEATLEAARRTDRAARRATADARRRLEQLLAAEGEDRRRFAAARDRLAELGPPPPGHVDLAADWAALTSWAAATRPAQAALVAAAEERAAALAAEHRSLTTALAERCREAGVLLDGRDPADAVADSVGDARAALAGIDQSMEEAAGHRVAAAEHGRTAAVARELGRHLSANHFEKWVLDEALHSLVAAATEILHELSGGDYSLGLDERSNFLVVDHRNADEVRSARTLSGGETFLASLALALALADQIGQLAAQGAARLESIFLDEGFGTLDPDALDTVAVAMEELGARGRTVGLVTHVAELAERMPVRFVVHKGPATSTVTRVAS